MNRELQQRKMYLQSVFNTIYMTGYVMKMTYNLIALKSNIFFGRDSAPDPLREITTLLYLQVRWQGDTPLISYPSLE